MTTSSAYWRTFPSTLKESVWCLAWFLKALGLEDYEILSGLEIPSYFNKTRNLNTDITVDQCLLEFHNRLRPIILEV